MPWQKIRLRIKYGLKYAAVELPLSLSQTQSSQCPHQGYADPAGGAFPGIGSEASKSSFSKEQGELLALEWFFLSNMVDDGRI
jgi:hypothetical protein